MPSRVLGVQGLAPVDVAILKPPAGLPHSPDPAVPLLGGDGPASHTAPRGDRLRFTAVPCGVASVLGGVGGGSGGSAVVADD